MASATSTSTKAANTTTATSHLIDDTHDSHGLLPQYGFGKTYTFNTLIEHHRFLFRVHTPKRKHGHGHGSGSIASRSRATSPQPSTRATFPTPFATPLRRPSLTHSRSPSTSTSLASSVRSGSLREGREGSSTGTGSDYFGLFPSSSPRIQNLNLVDAAPDVDVYEGEEEDGEEEEGAPGDPYFLSRRFKDDLTSSDLPTRRRTMSTLSTLSGSSSTLFGGHAHTHSHEQGHPGLDRSVSSLSGMHSAGFGGRTRRDSVTKPGARRSQSVGVIGTGIGLQSSSYSTSTTSHSAQPSEEEAMATSESAPSNMTYEDLVRHLDWTTRSSSPYVTTSFSFFWCLWEAVRRYKLSVKQDVEIAVIDARSVIGRARTALEILRGVDGGKQDKAYWKWYRFALESQDVLVFGAIPGDAIYASIPLTSILPRLPSYFFKPEPEVGLPAPNLDPREPVANAAAALNEVEDPRSPSSRSPTGTQPVFFPLSTPPRQSSLSGTPAGRPFSPRSDLSSYDFGSSEDGEERRQTAQLLSRLSWDIGTTLKPRRKSSSVGGSSASQAPRHTSHAEFCRALTRAFEGVGVGVESPGKNGESRKEEDKLRDATTSAVKLAEVLIEPWFRARCAEAADPFRFDESDSESSESEGEEGLCLGLAGDGCSLEHRHEKPATEDDTETQDPRMEAAETLTALSLDLARWPSNWWFAEHRQGIESLVKDVVGMCVRECARGVGMRVWWGVQSEYESQRRRAASEVGSPSSSFFDERKGRRRAESLVTGSPEPRGRDVRSRSAVSDRRATLVRQPSDGSPSRSYPSPVSMRESPYKPRARSPLGAVLALGPAIVLKSEKQKKGEASGDDAAKQANEDDWSPSTPPPTPPLVQSLTLPDSSLSNSMFDSNSTNTSSLDSATPSTPNKHRRSPPPPPPPRSTKRERETTLRKPASFTSLDSSIESLRALDSSQSQGNEGDVPGGWPEGDDDTSLGSPIQLPGPEGAPCTPQRAQRRPFSWSPGTSAFSYNNTTGIGPSHQRSNSDDSSLSGSRKSSQESLRPLGSASGFLQPSPSPKAATQRDGSTRSSPTGSLRKSARDKDGEAQDGEAFLAEVVSSALSLGTTPTAIFNLSSSPLKVDTSAARRDGHEKSHRRHSSIGEIDLSPVAELSGEKEAEEEDARARGESVFSLGSAMKAVEDLTLGALGGSIDARLSPIEDKLTFAEPEGLDENPSSYVESTRYSRSRRSSTLASIPEAEREEEWEEWTMIDVPTSRAASLKSTASSGASIHEQETGPVDNDVVVATPVEGEVLEAEIPLPPSPILAPLELGEEPTEIVEEMNVGVGEQVDSSSHERRSSVPEITLSVPQEETVNDIERTGESSTELPDTTQPDKDKLNTDTKSVSAPPPETEPESMPDPESSLKRIGRAVLKTMGLSFLIQTHRLFGSDSGAAPSGSTPSPALDDADMSTALVRWSPMFSALRYWSPLFRFLQRSRPSHSRSSSTASSSTSASQLILGPRPAWDSPIILDSDGGMEMPLRAGGMDLDDAFEVYSQGARSGTGFVGTSWAMSCFVCGVMASLALASLQRQREMQMLMGNRYY